MHFFWRSNRASIHAANKFISPAELLIEVCRVNYSSLCANPHFNGIQCGLRRNTERGTAQEGVVGIVVIRAVVIPRQRIEILVEVIQFKVLDRGKSDIFGGGVLSVAMRFLNRRFSMVWVSPR